MTRVKTQAALDRTLAADIRFGANGNAHAALIDGWSVPEHGYVWSMGAESYLRIPFQPTRDPLMLEVALTPMLAPPKRVAQRLSIRVNDVPIGGEAVNGPCVLTYPVPPSSVHADNFMRITLEHPGCMSPAELGVGDDHRRLAFALHTLRLRHVRPEPVMSEHRPPLLPGLGQSIGDLVRGATALTPADLVLRFESLGQNCEFGIVQQMLEADPLGLLRFAGIDPLGLQHGLDSSFGHIADTANMHPSTEPCDSGMQYAVSIPAYNVRFHTHMDPGEVPVEDMLRRMTTHLGFLRRLFLQKLEGPTIFVFHHPLCQSPTRVRSILNAVQAHGPNALLYVTEDADTPPGTVEQIAPDLFHGSIDRLLTRPVARDVNLPAWLSLCANTYRLWRQSGRGGSA